MPRWVRFTGKAGPSNDGYGPGDGTRKRRRTISVLQNFELFGPETALAHQLMRVIDFILAQNLQGRPQILPQQFDFGC